MSPSPNAAQPEAASGRRSIRWPLVLAIVGLIALAAIAGAAVLGLPGLRLTLGDPGTLPPTPSPTTRQTATIPTSPGAGLGLGLATTLDDAVADAGRPLQLPAGADLGAPDAVYFDPAKGDAVALVWAPSAGLPATLDDDIGLLIQSFEGSIDDEAYFEKIISGGATVEPVTVDGAPGFWVSGSPHYFFFNSADGALIDDGRRWVGDALVWSDGTTTYRLESALGRDGSLELAESLE